MESLVYKPFVSFAFENRGMENVIFLLRGNMSKEQILKCTERFRCRCLTSGQFRCWVFGSGRLGCWQR